MHKTFQDPPRVWNRVKTKKRRAYSKVGVYRTSETVLEFLKHIFYTKKGFFRRKTRHTGPIEVEWLTRLATLPDSVLKCTVTNGEISRVENLQFECSKSNQFIEYDGDIVENNFSEGTFNIAKKNIRLSGEISRVYSDRMLYNNTIEYRIVGDCRYNQWKQFKGTFLFGLDSSQIKYLDGTLTDSGIKEVYKNGKLISRESRRYKYVYGNPTQNNQTKIDVYHASKDSFVASIYDNHNNKHSTFKDMSTGITMKGSMRLCDSSKNSGKMIYVKEAKIVDYPESLKTEIVPYKAKGTQWLYDNTQPDDFNFIYYYELEPYVIFETHNHVLRGNRRTGTLYTSDLKTNQPTTTKKGTFDGNMKLLKGSIENTNGMTCDGEFYPDTEVLKSGKKTTPSVIENGNFNEKGILVQGFRHNSQSNETFEGTFGEDGKFITGFLEAYGVRKPLKIMENYEQTENECLKERRRRDEVQLRMEKARLEREREFQRERERERERQQELERKRERERELQLQRERNLERRRRIQHSYGGGGRRGGGGDMFTGMMIGAALGSADGAAMGAMMGGVSGGLMGGMMGSATPW
uniref:Uncharacterized protein n=1 Tax=viral metagenome TaxID=1070528 RepID=A0A6C0CJX4_9ZZZZ